MQALIQVLDDLSIDAQFQFEEFMGGRISTMVAPEVFSSALKDEVQEMEQIEEEKMKPTIFYWGIKARAQLPIMILTAGDVDFDWQQDPGDYKSFAPFGQLPVLKVAFRLDRK